MVGYLVLDPESLLIEGISKDDGTVEISSGRSVVFSLTNPTAIDAIFKVKFTAPDRADIKPNCGFISGLEQVEVVVTPTSEAFPEKFRPSEKLLVAAAKSPVSRNLWGQTKPREAWKSVEKSEVFESKLPIKFKCTGRKTTSGDKAGSDPETKAKGDLMTFPAEAEKNPPLRRPNLAAMAVAATTKSSINLDEQVDASKKSNNDILIPEKSESPLSKKFSKRLEDSGSGMRIPEQLLPDRMEHSKVVASAASVDLVPRSPSPLESGKLFSSSEDEEDELNVYVGGGNVCSKKKEKTSPPFRSFNMSNNNNSNNTRSSKEPPQHIRLNGGENAQQAAVAAQRGQQRVPASKQSSGMKQVKENEAEDLTESKKDTTITNDVNQQQQQLVTLQKELFRLKQEVKDTDASLVILKESQKDLISELKESLKADQLQAVAKTKERIEKLASKLDSKIKDAEYQILMKAEQTNLHQSKAEIRELSGWVKEDHNKLEDKVRDLSGKVQLVEERLAAGYASKTSLKDLEARVNVALKNLSDDMVNRQNEVAEAASKQETPKQDNTMVLLAFSCCGLAIAGLSFVLATALKK